MKKRIWLLPLLILTSVLLTGCALQTVNEMYALPKRSKEYDSLQSAIDSAMYGLSYSAPVSGENRQTVQMADLDGDGVEEYIVFAQGSSANPLQVLIFRQEEDGTCRLMEVIQSNGSAFEQVEYVQMDDAPGYELVVGRQLSDQVLRSVSVYSFSGGSAEQLMMVGYSKFITCDLDDDGCSELMVILPGESETGTGSAVLYRVQDGSIERSVEVNGECIPHPADHGGTAAGRNPCGIRRQCGKRKRHCDGCFCLAERSVFQYFLFPGFGHQRPDPAKLLCVRRRH